MIKTDADQYQPEPDSPACTCQHRSDCKIHGDPEKPTLEDIVRGVRAALRVPEGVSVVGFANMIRRRYDTMKIETGKQWADDTPSWQKPTPVDEASAYIRRTKL